MPPNTRTRSSKWRSRGFPRRAHWPAGKIVGVIGFLDDPNVETQVIIKKFGLPTQFPKEVEEEAAQLPDAIRESDLEGRDDFRKRNTITIDPTTARDFDDAIDVERSSRRQLSAGRSHRRCRAFCAARLGDGPRGADPRHVRLFSGSRPAHASGEGFEPSVLAEPEEPIGSR